MFRKKHPLTFSFISLWKLFTFSYIFLAMFRRKQVVHSWKVTYSLLPVTSYFRACKLWDLPLKTDIWRNVKAHQLVIVSTEPKNMLIHHTIFHCELFSWFIFLAECKILNFADVGRRTRTVSLRGWPLVRYQSNGLILPVMSFLFNHFIPQY